MRRGKTMLAVFVYEAADGSQKEWVVGCVCPPDNKRSMRAHFKKWRPKEQLISIAFEDFESSDKKLNFGGNA